MSSAPPTSSRAQTNGVLPITVSQTSSRAAVVKPTTPKLKVIIRRLPPGLTEAEFANILGVEWTLGQGKVDWFLFKPGKDSKDPSKPSRPSRAYLHLTSENHLLPLSDTVRQSSFEDAQNTFNSPALIGPPSVEFAPYGRTPGGRRRMDARSGTIDQDPEFMSFLESLANPVSSKEVSADTLAAGTSQQTEKVKTTPLVQYLKDKKANKIKEGTTRLGKRQESLRGKSAPGSTEVIKRKGKDVKVDRLVEKAAKEAVRILNREAASKTGNEASSTTSEASGSATSTTPPKLDITKIPQRQRGAAVAAHIRMLQRDLGLSPAQAHRQVRRDAADIQRAEKAAAKSATESPLGTSQPPQTPLVPTAPKGVGSQSSSRRSRGKGPDSETKTPQAPTSSAGSSAPVVLLKKPDAPQSTSATPPVQPAKPSPAARKPPPSPAPSEGATQAFVKHANPSQGVTEELLKEAMEKFGAVSMVEIDKRKGFAYVDFVAPAGLELAMAKSPISVAQGTVQVLERKERKPTAPPPEKKLPPQIPHVAARNGRGGRGGIGRRGRGGARGGAATGAAPPSSSDTSKAPASAPTGPAAK